MPLLRIKSRRRSVIKPYGLASRHTDRSFTRVSMRNEAIAPTRFFASRACRDPGRTAAFPVLPEVRAPAGATTHLANAAKRLQLRTEWETVICQEKAG